jgi:TATA-binding protein-associated factor Taf7
MEEIEKLKKDLESQKKKVDEKINPILKSYCRVIKG